MSKCPSIANGLPFCGHPGEQTKSSVGFRITAIVLGILTVSAALCALFGVPLINQIGTTYSWTLFSVGALFVLVAASIKCVKNEPSIEKPPQNDLLIDQVVEKLPTDPLPPSVPAPPQQEMAPKSSKIVELYNKKYPPSTEKKYTNPWLGLPRDVWQGLILRGLDNKSVHCLSMVNSHFAYLADQRFKTICEKELEPKSTSLTHSSWTKQHTQLSGGWLLPGSAKEDKIKCKYTLKIEDNYDEKRSSFGSFVVSDSKLFAANNVWDEHERKYIGVIKVYDLTTGELKETLDKGIKSSIQKLHIFGTSVIAVHRNGRVCFCDSDISFQTDMGGSLVSHSQIRGSNLIVASTSKPEIQIWDLHTETLLRTLKGDKPTESITSIHCAGDKMISVSSNGVVMKFESDRPVDQFQLHGEIEAVQIAGDKIIFASLGLITIRDLSTLNVLDTFVVKAANGNMSALCFNITKDFVAAADSELKQIGVWDVKTGKKLIERTDAALNRPSYCPAIVGNTFLLADDHQIQIWDIPTGELLSTIAHGVTSPQSLSVIDNRIVLKGREAIALYDILL